MNIILRVVWNAYLFEMTVEKCHVTIKDAYMFEPSAANKKAIIVTELYVLKSSANAWR